MLKEFSLHDMHLDRAQMRVQPSLGSKDHRGIAAALGHALVALSGVTLPVMFSKHHPDTLDRTNGIRFLARESTCEQKVVYKLICSAFSIPFAYSSA